MEAAYITVIVLQSLCIAVLVVGLRDAVRERDKARKALNKLVKALARRQDGVDYQEGVNTTSVGGHG